MNNKNMMKVSLKKYNEVNITWKICLSGPMSCEEYIC